MQAISYLFPSDHKLQHSNSFNVADHISARPLAFNSVFPSCCGKIHVKILARAYGSFAQGYHKEYN